MPLIALDYLDLALAATLLLVNAGLSIWLQLGLARDTLIAAARMVVQLGLMGLVLKVLFTLVSPWLTALFALLMVLFAGREAMARQERRLSGWWGYGVGTAAMLAAAAVVTLFALTTQVQPEPWYDPRYAIPLLGMILGNTMTGVALGLHTLTTTASREKGGIEAQLMLGRPRGQALRPVAAAALHTALMPIVNSMAATGLVAIPGMMTGQILSGVDPVEAVKYQTLIMFLIAGGTGFGALTAVLAGAARLTDARHRLRLDRLAAKKG
ncbi:MAG: iron export ABC transporter permease subunit FetB [Rhodospirillales bacterium]|nr:MAG: iron export ABC transporter permease subunit FetB [Rhodospirillales bacterium]